MRVLRISLLVAHCLVLLSQVVVAQDERHFSAQAKVIDTQTVYQSQLTTVAATNCAQPVATIAHSLAQDVLEQERRYARQSACAKRLSSRRKVRGYWVTYEYRGHTGRKFMYKKPGNWISVSVRLEPLHTSHRR